MIHTFHQQKPFSVYLTSKPALSGRGRFAETKTTSLMSPPTVLFSTSSIYPFYTKIILHIVTCQAHPVLVKIRRIRYAIRALRTKGSLAPCLVAARAVRWRPRLAGTREYIVTNTRPVL